MGLGNASIVRRPYKITLSKLNHENIPTTKNNIPHFLYHKAPKQIALIKLPETVVGTHLVSLLPESKVHTKDQHYDMQQNLTVLQSQRLQTTVLLYEKWIYPCTS